MIEKQSFLDLVRLGIGHLANINDESIDWDTIRALAEEQGLSAIILDGVEKLPNQQRPPTQLLLEWIGEALQGYEFRYDMYRKTIAELAGFYNSHGYKMMVLKGYACSLNWPKPEHRPCGDIDIWLFGKQKEADAILAKEKGIEIDTSHHHHTVFYWQDFMVENHYDFVNVHARRSNAEIEKVLKDMGKDDTRYVEINREKVYLPSPNLHALFLIKHAVSHFVGANINLRQVLDWAFFAEKHTEEINWKWLNTVMEKYHMKDFYNCINAICVEELGFSANIFHGVQFNPIIKDRVLKDILYPRFSVSEPARLIPRLLYKYKRWKGNGWKHKLCYNESLWSAFLGGVWSHLLKPASI